ncbi:MAG: hypothetical protein RSF33_05350 [Hydrogenoanaerobacterium sp.]
MNKQIGLSLNHAVNQLPRPSFEAIASAPVQKMYMHDDITRQPEHTHRSIGSLNYRLTAVLACCIMCFTFGLNWFWQNLAVSSLITIDVNPSFELTVNRNDKILEIKALNADAVEFLNEKNFRGLALDNAVEVLFSDLAKSRYMNTDKNNILISVQNKDTAQQKKLEQALTIDIEKGLTSSGIKPNIVLQELNDNKEMQKEAHKYNVSSGKMQLVHKLYKNNTAHSLEELAAMPLAQLLKLEDIEADSDDDDDDSKSEAEQSSKDDSDDHDSKSEAESSSKADSDDHDSKSKAEASSKDDSDDHDSKSKAEQSSKADSDDHDDKKKAEQSSKADSNDHDSKSEAEQSSKADSDKHDSKSEAEASSKDNSNNHDSKSEAEASSKAESNDHDSKSEAEASSKDDSNNHDSKSEAEASSKDDSNNHDSKSETEQSSKADSDNNNNDSVEITASNDNTAGSDSSDNGNHNEAENDSGKED